MAAPVLYTALVPLTVRSLSASWPCPAGGTLPLNPASALTLRLLAEGSVVLAGEGAVDDVTPPLIVRGVPGLHVAVSN